MSTFSIGTQVHVQGRELPFLQTFPMQRALVICDPFLQKNGMADLVTGQLSARGTAWTLFDQIQPDPTVELVAAGVAAAAQAVPDAIIAMGGGSAIDTAKAISYIYTQTSGNPRPQLIAIPTTSGTGSEATAFAVITDPQTGTKYPLVSDEMLPQVALLCPALTLSVPPQITADTGFDVLTHAMEAYVSSRATDYSDALAEKAFSLTLAYLSRAVKNGADAEARERLQNASCMAGMAFNSAGLGLCHSMAHALGARLHLPHGRSNAILLPRVIDFNAQEPGAAKRYAALAKLAGCCCHSEETAVHGLIRLLERMLSEVGIGTRLEGPQRQQAALVLSDMAEAALQDRCLADNPRAATATQIVMIYQQLL